MDGMDGCVLFCFISFTFGIWVNGLLFLMVAGHPKIFSAYGTTGSLI